MVMFKTSKPRLAETRHLHFDKMEQMRSLESVKVKRRRKCNLSLHRLSLRLLGEAAVEKQVKPGVGAATGLDVI